MDYVGGTSLLRGETGSGLNSIPNRCSACQGLFPEMFDSVAEFDRSYVLLFGVNSLNRCC